VIPRPSELFRHELCPGWWLVPQSPQEDSPEAAEGKKLHRAMAALVEKKPLEPLDDEQMAAVKWAWDEVQPLMVEGSECLAEMKMHGKDGSSGTIDLVVLCHDCLHLIDYKFGRADQGDVAGHLQLHQYGIYACDRWNTHVTLHLIQPRLRSHSRILAGQNVLENARAQIAGIVAKSQNATIDDLNPGSPQCDYCPGKVNCPRLSKELAVLPANAPKIATAEEMTSHMELAAIAEKWAKAVKSEAKRRLMQGEEVPGYTLASRKSSKIESIGAAYAKLKETLSREDLLLCCSISLPKIVEAVAKSKDISNAKARREVESTLGEIIVEEVSKVIKRA